MQGTLILLMQLEWKVLLANNRPIQIQMTFPSLKVQKKKIESRLSIPKNLEHIT
jgi:hypothetical protein